MCSLRTLSQFELGNFKEDGLILEPGEVLPLAVGYCYSYLTHLTNGGVLDMRRSFLYVNRAERNMSSSFIESVLKLVTHFHDNSHCELGLKTVSQVLIICLLCLSLSLSLPVHSCQQFCIFFGCYWQQVKYQTDNRRITASLLFKR